MALKLLYIYTKYNLFFNSYSILIQVSNYFSANLSLDYQVFNKSVYFNSNVDCSPYSFPKVGELVRFFIKVCVVV